MPPVPRRRRREVRGRARWTVRHDTGGREIRSEIGPDLSQPLAGNNSTRARCRVRATEVFCATLTLNGRFPLCCELAMERLMILCLDCLGPLSAPLSAKREKIVISEERRSNRLTYRWTL